MTDAVELPTTCEAFMALPVVDLVEREIIPLPDTRYPDLKGRTVDRPIMRPGQVLHYKEDTVFCVVHQEHGERVKWGLIMRDGILSRCRMYYD